MNRFAECACGAVFALVLGGLALSCATAFEPIETPARPKVGDFEEEEAVILLNRTEVVFADEGEPVAYERSDWHAMALKDSGRWVMNFSVGYDADWTEPLELQAHTVRPDGKTTTWTKDDAIDMPSMGGYTLYSDNRRIRFDFSKLPLKTLLAGAKRVRSRNVQFKHIGFYFGQSAPSLKSRFEVVVPDGWEIEHSAMRLDQKVEFKPAVTEEEGQRRFVWMREDQSALKSERFGPQLYRGTMVNVRLVRWTEDGEAKSGFEDERGPSAWLHKQTQGRATSNDELAAIAKSVLKDASDEPRDKARRLYAWTRDNINYCSIQVGWGGWVPHDARETVRLRYGDCKDKANILRTLLKLGGVESRLAQLHTNDGMAFPYYMPTVIGNSNHQILQVALPDGDVLVDPTTDVVAFGRLPLSDQGAWVLPQDEAGARLIRAPVEPPEVNLWATTYDLAFTPGEAIEGEFSVVLDGHYGDDLRGALLRTTASGYDKAVGRFVHLPGGETSDVVIENGAPQLDPIPVTAKGKIKGAIVRRGDQVLFRVTRYLWDVVPTLPEDSERVFPVVFSARLRRHDVVRLKLPAGASVQALPEPVTLSTEYFDYELQYAFKDGALVIDRRFDRKKRNTPPAAYGELREGFASILATESQPIVLHMSPRGS